MLRYSFTIISTKRTISRDLTKVDKLLTLCKGGCMQILMISGSRNREGRTARSIGAIGQGFIKAGGNSEYIFLPELNIERCRQCDPDGSGVCMREHRCIIEDDFASIVTKLEAADLVVFASPVYFIDLSESLRAF